ncbi:hypothetical protein [Kitasatospora sp. NPDC127116]|uniref:hypothetical protein n=1 Tax=Kitasatospora sp. NPDC127116 TaxID=3345367 RepID=UPI00338C15B4
METRIDEIAERVYRVSTFVPEIAPPTGFTFNQFLVDAEEPLIFHTGMRRLFPGVSEAIGKVVPLERLRWVTFGHVEADECGAMNEFLAAAPHARVAHNTLGCLVSLNDLADRPPVPMDDGEVLDLGGRQVRRRLRNINTPHVPHGWEARVLFEEQTRTLFCGDLAGVRRAAQRAGGPAPVAQSASVIRMPTVPRSPRRSRLPSRVSTPSRPYFWRSSVR